MFWIEYKPWINVNQTALHNCLSRERRNHNKIRKMYLSIYKIESEGKRGRKKCIVTLLLLFLVLTETNQQKSIRYFLCCLRHKSTLKLLSLATLCQGCLFIYHLSCCKWFSEQDHMFHRILDLLCISFLWNRNRTTFTGR